MPLPSPCRQSPPEPFLFPLFWIIGMESCFAPVLAPPAVPLFLRIRIGAKRNGGKRIRPSPFLFFLARLISQQLFPSPFPLCRGPAGAAAHFTSFFPPLSPFLPVLSARFLSFFFLEIPSAAENGETIKYNFHAPPSLPFLLHLFQGGRAAGLFYLSPSPRHRAVGDKAMPIRYVSHPLPSFPSVRPILILLDLSVFFPRASK